MDIKMFSVLFFLHSEDMIINAKETNRPLLDFLHENFHNYFETNLDSSGTKMLGRLEPQLTTETIVFKRRRDVPTSSYSKFEDLEVDFKVEELPSIKTPGPGYPSAGPGATKFHNDNVSKKESFNSDGSFSHTFKTKDGIYSRVSGYQKSLGGGDHGQAMRGQYSYTAPDGTAVNVWWTADERGYRPETGTQFFRMRFGRLDR